MSALSIPNSFVNGTVINSSPFNANFSTIVTWSTAVDNANIGPAGLFASQLRPLTGAQATFGLTATGVGYKFLANDATAVPLTIAGAASQSVDLLAVTLTAGGTKVFSLGSAGGLNGTTGAFTSTLSAVGITSTANIAATGYVGASALGAGSISIPGTAGNGSGIFQSTASAGTIFLGGGTSAARFDYGQSIAGQLSYSLAGVIGWGAAAGGALFSGPGPSASSNANNMHVTIARGDANAATSGGLVFGNGTNAQTSFIGGGASGNGAGTLTLCPVTNSSNGLSVSASAVTSSVGPIAAPLTAGGTAAYVPPMFTSTGASRGTSSHIVMDTVVAAGATTTITLAGSAVFTGASTYVVTVYDLSAQAAVAVTIASGSSFSFASTSTHNYQYVAVGY